MKKTYFIFLFFVTTIIACQHKQTDLKVDQEFTIAATETTDETVLAALELIESDSAIFSRRLQWAAFLSANVLRFDLDARQEIEDLLSNEEDNDLNLDLLIGESAITPAFKSAFYLELESYIVGYAFSLVGRPDPQEDTPPQPISERLDNSVKEQVEIYINYMTEGNCVELYFPKGIHFDKGLAASSTAHPLNTDDHNVGWLRFKKPILLDGNFIPTKKVKIDDAYLIKNINIVVARPYRDISNEECLYLDYPFDLESFLFY